MQVFSVTCPQLRDLLLVPLPSSDCSDHAHVILNLCDDGAGSGGLVLPGRGQDTDGLVVAGQAVDSRLDENEAELGVLVLAVALEVLADGDSLHAVSKHILGDSMHATQRSEI
jgi:hypothetical protein